MNTRYIRSFVFAVASVSLVTCSFAAKKSRLPDWVTTAMEGRDAYDRFDPEANALVLLSQLKLGYQGRGIVESVGREVVHIKTRDERKRASAMIPIVSDSQRLVSFDAWILYPSGNIETFTKRDLFEVAQSKDALFSEAKALILDRSDSVRSDVVFAYEYELVEKTVFSQVAWNFQDSIPTVHSEIEINLPKGWAASGVFMNDRGIEESHSDGEYIWRAFDLPGVKDELSRPPSMLLYSQVGVSLKPPAKEKALVFDSWNDVGGYGAEVQAGQLEPSQEIKDKTLALVAGLNTEWEKVRVICEYAQSVNYVSIELDLNSGGGYKPHKAEDIFRRHYGDCKDMTALTRSMLKTINIDSYAVLASVGNDAYVHDQWPSPHQFNHCIVGIALTDPLKKPAVIDHEALGKILIFDPTQQFAPVGQLPQSLQGTKVLISSSESSSLNRLALAGEEENVVHRNVSVVLQKNGSLKGKIHEQLKGSSAEFFRMVERTKSEEELKKFLMQWIAAGTRDAIVLKIETEDRFYDNAYELTIEFEAPYYARRAGGTTMIFNPVFLGRRTWVPPDSEERQSDYMSFPWSLIESVEYSVPESYRIDGDLKNFAHEATFGDYKLKSINADNLIRVERVMRSRQEVISPDRYDEVVDYYEKIARSDSSPIVLIQD
jgi:hypothetical protein